MCSQVCNKINWKANEGKTFLLVVEHYSKRGEDSRELIWSPNEESRRHLAAGISWNDVEGKWCNSAILGESKQGKKIEVRLSGSNTKNMHSHACHNFGRVFPYHPIILCISSTKSASSQSHFHHLIHFSHFDTNKHKHPFRALHYISTHHLCIPISFMSNPCTSIPNSRLF